jgi:hypothetical protein
MTAYHERSFAQRFGAMGDKAEAIFLELNPTAHRLGLNRPEFSMAGMSADMRYTPDFLTRDNFVEVMGFSSRGNNTLKLKFDKADALVRWSILGPVILWVYDSGAKRYWQSPIQDWVKACYEHGERCSFPDNRALYWDLPSSLFPGAPTSVTA